MIVANEFDSKETLERKLSSRILTCLNLAIAKKGEASILFSGGSTPIALLNKLASAEFDWKAVKIGLVDDRMVDRSSNFSNQLMLHRELIDRIESENRPQFFPLVSNPENPALNMTIAEQSAKALKVPDVVVLGMGTDGHFASIFPKDEASKKALNTEEAILAYTQAPTAPQTRITFCWAYLNSAKKILLHITGQAKKDILDTVGKRSDLPIDTVINNSAREVEIYWTA